MCHDNDLERLTGKDVSISSTDYNVGTDTTFNSCKIQNLVCIQLITGLATVE